MPGTGRKPARRDPPRGDWGGMPGRSFKPDHAPAALAALRADADF